MKETERIADQLKRAFYGEAWSGPCVKEVLEGVTAGIAARRPIPGAHSIWELVNHIGAWATIVRRRIEGESVTVTEEINFPPAAPDGSDASWTQSVRAMEKAEKELRETVLRLPESRLDQPAAPGDATVYVQLQGVVQHSLYHAGQIALLKKTFL
jgi:hypothetical protein